MTDGEIKIAVFDIMVKIEDLQVQANKLVEQKMELLKQLALETRTS
jgi:hypothetical protein